MSISSSVNKNKYLGNSAVDTYAYTFIVFKKEDIRVIETDDEGVETVLVLDVDYTVTGVRQPAGGAVIRTAGNLPTGYTWTIRRVVELTQETDIRNQGDFFPEAHEDQFDKLVMADQQQQEEIDRSIKLPESILTSDFDPTLPTDVGTPGRAIVVNSTGDGLVMGATEAVDGVKLFNSVSYSSLKALAISAPTEQRWGWATDIKQLVFYTADITVGDAGWISVGG